MDTLKGTARRILDGQTFELAVKEIGEASRLHYENVERIRIVTLNSREIGKQEGEQATVLLERKLMGREIFCDVVARFKTHIAAKVKLL